MDARDIPGHPPCDDIADIPSMVHCLRDVLILMGHVPPSKSTDEWCCSLLGGAGDVSNHRL